MRRSPRASVLRFALAFAAFCVSAVAQTAGFASGPTNHLYRMDLSTGQVLVDTFIGTQLQGAKTLASRTAAGWTLVGAADFDHNGVPDLVYFNRSTGRVSVSYYGGPYAQTRLSSTSLVTPGSGWTAQAVADLNRDGNPDVIFVNDVTRQVEVYFYAGPNGAIFQSRAEITSLPSGSEIVGLADFNRDGHPDLVVQNVSSGEISIHYLGGADGATVEGTTRLAGTLLAQWRVAGALDFNGDGRPDIVSTNDRTEQVVVSYFGGALGLNHQNSVFLDSAGSSGWKIVVPSSEPSQAFGSSTAVGSSAAIAISTGVSTAATYIHPPILLFNGTGTSSSDVSALASVLKNLGLNYQTVNSRQLDGMTQAQLATYRLFIVPGGNSIQIGDNLTSHATSIVHSAVQQDGLHYLGFCAGGFFGGYSKYNGLNLTSGVWFNFYGDYYKGINIEPVNLYLANGSRLDVYWQDGPQLSGWGKVIAKYPNGSPAIAEGYVGKGFVILLGVHPEAPASWRYGMNFSTPLSVDLAYAGTLVKAALGGYFLPHY